MLGLSGCTNVGVLGYGDSIISRPGDGFADSRFGGQALINALGWRDDPANQNTVTYHGWYSTPGTTMYSHPNNASGRVVFDPNTSGSVVLISFGTNDANYWGQSGGKRPPAEAVVKAQEWIDVAKQRGAKCIVWVRPPDVNALNSGILWQQYKDWMAAFSGWLDSKVAEDPTHFYILEWGRGILPYPGYSFDGLHPNTNGGTEMGHRVADIAVKQVCGGWVG